MIDAALFKALQARGEPALSVYFPLDPRQGDRRDPATRLRALAGRTAQALTMQGLDGDRARDLVGALEETADGFDLAHHRDAGFGFFATPTWSRMITLPALIAETVVVADSFHIKPLLPMLARNRRFHVLALSAGDARLYSATPFAWDEIALDILPDHLEAEPDGARSARATPGRGGNRHTTAQSPEELRHALLMRDMGRVAQAVRQALGEDPAPLLLAGEAQTAGPFRQVARIAQLQELGLQINPFGLAPRELHARATALMQPLLDTEPEQVLEQARARLGSAVASVDFRVEEILERAREGRVEAIVAAEDQALWGRTAEAPHGHQVDAEPDLLNEAAVETLRHGGRAYALPVDRLPRRALAVALYRF